MSGEARIYVGWHLSDDVSYFLTTAGSSNPGFQEQLAEMVQDLGPPTTVEFRAADEGYIEGYCDGFEDDDDYDEAKHGSGLRSRRE
jgi:hypothetical protein